MCKHSSCWKAETKHQTVDHIEEPEVIQEPEAMPEPEAIQEPEVRERKLCSGEKVFIPAGSAKLLKVRVEGD